MRVKVYHDPITRKRLEGIAEVYLIKEGTEHPHGLKYCEVKCGFDEDMDDNVVWRTVHKDDFIDDEDGDIVCTDCGESGVITGHMGCQYPGGIK